MTWSRLIRFVDEDEHTTFGDALVENGEDLFPLLQRQQLYAIQLTGNDPFALARTDVKVRVGRLLGVLNEENIKVFRCIGLNYLKHIAEGGRKTPPYPSTFMKPSTAVAAFDADIRVPAIAQGKNLDYEGELAVIIGRTGRNISKEEAISHVAGYAASNDVSARTWQNDPAYGVGATFAKSFDTFNPLGPMLVSPSIVGSADNLNLRTTVNGELRQDSSTSDMLFNVAAIISFLSQGTTLQKGSVIMTGTPGGVAFGMPEPKWLRDGDVVEVKIEHLGSCVNKVVYE